MLCLSLDMFDSFSYCQFKSTSRSCLLVNEMTRPNKGLLAKTSCSYVDKIRRVVTEYYKLSSVFLHNATYGDNLQHETHQSDEIVPMPHTGLQNYRQRTVPATRDRPLIQWFSNFSKRSSMELKITDTALEVGSLDNIYGITSNSR